MELVVRSTKKKEETAIKNAETESRLHESSKELTTCMVKKNNKTEQENKNLKQKAETTKEGIILQSIKYKDVHAENKILESKMHESLKESARINDEISRVSKKLEETTEKYEDKMQNEIKLNLTLKTIDNKRKRTEEESINYIDTNSNIFYEDYDKYEYMIGKSYSKDSLMKRSDCKGNVKLSNDCLTNLKNLVVSSDQ